MGLFFLGGYISLHTNQTGKTCKSSSGFKNLWSQTNPKSILALLWMMQWAPSASSLHQDFHLKKNEIITLTNLRVAIGGFNSALKNETPGFNEAFHSKVHLANKNPVFHLCLKLVYYSLTCGLNQFSVSCGRSWGWIWMALIRKGWAHEFRSSLMLKWAVMKAQDQSAWGATAEKQAAGLVRVAAEED